jgi:hypothetical protein
MWILQQQNNRLGYLKIECGIFYIAMRVLEQWVLITIPTTDMPFIASRFDIHYKVMYYSRRGCDSVAVSTNKWYTGKSAYWRT